MFCYLCLSFVSFCWPWSCLSSDLTIYVCPFGIFEFLLINAFKNFVMLTCFCIVLFDKKDGPIEMWVCTGFIFERSRAHHTTSNSTLVEGFVGNSRFIHFASVSYGADLLDMYPILIIKSKWQETAQQFNKKELN